MSESYQYLSDDALQALLETQRQNLADSERQSALYGPLDVPLRLINQIREVQTAIKDILAELNRRHLSASTPTGQPYLIYEARYDKGFDTQGWTFTAPGGVFSDYFK